MFDLEGETSRARAYYDSARVGYEAWIKESTERPTHPGVFTHLGISYAGLGRAEEAIREAGRSEPVSTEQLNGFANVYALAEVYVMVGDYDSAIDQLETVLSIACPVSPPLLKADPIWDPLRDHPRFQALLEKYSQPT